MCQKMNSPEGKLGMLLRQTEETNSSRGIGQRHHSLRTSSRYETRGRHELGLVWRCERVSGQGGGKWSTPF